MDEVTDVALENDQIGEVDFQVENVFTLSDGNDHERTEEENEAESLEQKLCREKEEMEKDFGVKRAKFMELFKQKETELVQEREIASSLRLERDELFAKVVRLQNELDECKSEVAIAECTKENEVDEEKRKCRDEIASLQQIVKETMSDAALTKSKYEREIARLKKLNEKLEYEIQEMKSPAPPTSTTDSSKEGVLSAVTKMAKRVSNLNAYSQSADSIHDNLEDSMKKAQEDAEVLRSLVVPLEEEIQALKEKLRAADDQIRSFENNSLRSLDLSSEFNVERRQLPEGENELDEKILGLHKGLQAEKSSRSDLEMYVSVLQTQKTMLQAETDDMRKQLRDVCQILDKEKREHNELKQTWQMANDQFLEAQKVQSDDLKRIQSILTVEQQKTVAELQKKDSGPEGVDSQASSKRSSPVSFPSSPRLRKSPSPARQLGTVLDRVTGDDNKAGNVFSFESERKDYPLQSLLESVSSLESVDDKAASECVSKLQLEGIGEALPLLGKRLISDKEWIIIQEELKSAKEKLGRPCDMCSNYEAQLQKSQEKERELQRVIKSLEKSNEWHKSDLQNEQQMKKELEEKLAQASTGMQEELAVLYKRIDEAEKLYFEIRHEYADHVQWAKSTLRDLSSNREEIDVELNRLQQENDKLVGKYTMHSQQMQNEAINLPDSTEDMHLLLLKLQEELIIAKVAKEHIDETLRSEILFLKERVLGEQQSRESTEQILTQETLELRQRVAILENQSEQHEDVKRRCNEAEKNFKDMEQKLSETQAKHKQMFTALQKKVEEGIKNKERLEMELNQQRLKVQTLQMELDNSEVVQRDFVKLSQSLQVQLEKIRESESEVRWQHEEDAEDCSNCKQPFTVTRRRHHCRHCGKIFCADCTSKVVLSGPYRRPSKVCDVCHTLLCPETAPYFSTEPPHTPE